MFSFHLDKYLGIRLLSHRIFNFIRNCQTFQSISFCFYIFLMIKDSKNIFMLLLDSVYQCLFPNLLQDVSVHLLNFSDSLKFGILCASFSKLKLY